MMEVKKGRGLSCISQVPEKTIIQLDTLLLPPKLIVEPNHDERLS